MDAFWQKSLAGLSLGSDGDGLDETETDAVDAGTETTPPLGSNSNVVGFGHYSGSYNPFKRSSFNADFGTVVDPEAAIKPPKASLKEVVRLTLLYAFLSFPADPNRVHWRSPATFACAFAQSVRLCGHIADRGTNT